MHTLSQNLYELLTIFSQQEARRVNADTVEPEHILLALITKKLGRGYRLLEKLHVNFLTLQLRLEQSMPIREGEPVK